MTNEQLILLVEDDPAVGAEIVNTFEGLGMKVKHVTNGNDGLVHALSDRYALVILDVKLPGMTGFDICREIRKARPLLPLIMLTSRSAEIDRVLGFELGADDYIVKPFSSKELLARVRSKLRRDAEIISHLVNQANQADETPMTSKVGDISLDFNLRTALKNGVPIKLTSQEFELLSYFMQNKGKVLSKEVLLRDVWKVKAQGYEDALSSMVLRLRKKIENDYAKPQYIRTSHGVGYLFDSPDNPEGLDP